MENLQSCPICKATAFTKHLECKDHTVSQETFTLLKCNGCSFVFTNPRPDMRESGRYYDSEDYISHSGTKKGLVNRLYHMVRNRSLRQKRSMVSNYSAKGPVLDIGSGSGEFLNELLSAGFNASGIELGEKARERSIEQYNLKVIPPAESDGLDSNSVEVITMWHVMEHVHLLQEQVAQIYRLLKPGGVAIIAVPNHESHDAQHYGAMWAGYDVPRHLYHFALGNMTQLFEEKGFETLGHQFMPFDAFYVSLLSEKYKKNPIALISGFWQGFVTFIKAKSNPRKGSSLIYRFRKPA